MLLIIDNYDSFTYNLYQAFGELKGDPRVVKNNEITLKEIEELNPSGIILSPGPGRPEEAGISLDAIRRFRGKIPIFGVCLGHQAIGIAFGAELIRASEVFHGKGSLIFHSETGLFKGVPSPFQAGRYHSLVLRNLPEELPLDAATADGVIMGLHHRTDPIFGVQFHPESLLTPEGKTIMENFLKVCCDR